MVRTIDSLIETVSFTPRSILFPSSWVGHLPFASWLIREVAPEIFVELGTHSGNSYFSFCQAVSEAKLSTKCYAIDSWQGEEHTGTYGEEIFQQVSSHNQEYYACFSSLLRMTFDEAADYFSDGSIDLLHIDGLHTYEAVKHDFETWLPKLAPGAIVLFHDTNARERGFGVWKFWEELQNIYPNNLEFFHSYGLGVLQLDGDTEKKIDWLQPSATVQKKIKKYFSALGEKQVIFFDRQQLTDSNSNFTQLITERDSEIAGLNQLVAEHDGQIAGLNQLVTERDGQIAGLNQLVAERDSQIAGLNQLVTERDSEIAGLNQLVAERDSEIAGLNQLITERDDQIGAFLVSSSWRLMAPLRTVMSLFRRLKVTWRSASRALQQSGGFFRTGTKTLKVFNREGFKGIRQRLRNIRRKESQPTVYDEDGKEVDRNDYTEWIRRYDTLTDEIRTKMFKRIEEFTSEPLISVVMPTYNSNPEWLVEAIESVRAQIYPNWELCIADDASTSETVRPILERYAKEDPRIKVVFRKENGHISAASNSALELVTGKYVALLDHDDFLPEHALFWVVDAINSHPEVQLIYSDEDKIDVRGQRSAPYFKCEWNQDLFYSQNMFSHLGVYNVTLIREVGGFRTGFEGSQDYDLALRCIEKIETEQIVHIPRVLYHWRVHSESTAQDSGAKPYAMLAGEKAINEHFARRGIAAHVEAVRSGYRAHYFLPDSPPLISLIIPTQDSLQLIRQCIESILLKTRYPNYEIIIVDNSSTDPATLNYLETLNKKSRVRVLNYNQPFNYSAMNNYAVQKAQGELVGLVNNDIEVISPGWLDELVSHALRPEVGAVGAKLFYVNNTVQHAGVILGVGGVAGHSHKYILRGHYGYFGRADLIQSLSAVTAACLVVRKEIYEKVNGLDEESLQVAFNDVDFCLKLRSAGYRNVWTPYAELYHHESATRGYEDTPEKQVRFAGEVSYMKDRWGYHLLNDPAYSPNLTLNHDDFSLAWPPRVNSLNE